MSDAAVKNVKARDFIIKWIFEISIVVSILILGITTKGFMSWKNISGIFRNMAQIGVLAYGITFAISCGEIDLSVPSTVALTGIVIGLCCNRLPIPADAAVFVGIFIMLLFSVIIGLLNTLLTQKFKMPAFIATMAVMYVVYGFAAIISRGFPVIGFPGWYNFIGAGNILGVIPVPAVIMVAMFVLSYFMMNHTKFGRAVNAVGGNVEAARLSGIQVLKVKTFTFIYVQLCALLSGIMVSSQVMSANFNFGKTWDFQAISCVVIGGTSFMGGRGRIWGTFIGLFFYGIVTNAMTLLNVNQYGQYIVRGVLITIAVIINLMRKD
jgi:ribose/xylose/arabinose/galactoside ABC-type transport system permease subunit